jgi:hypothetical protein
MLRTYSLISHRRCTMFFSQYSVSPCQHHSNSAPYLFINLAPTLHNVFLPVLCVPLSVSLHQCSILIHSSPTDAAQCFSPSTLCPPVSITPPMLRTYSLISHRRCIMFFSQYSVSPCRHHSTNAPYLFINLAPTLHNVFLPVLCVRLSASLQQCSVLIFVL